ncbi:MGT family glycosyltransferase [Actinomadura pelletieri DSM 43383]|uniref:MGT family glycosyltransferase n=1 Tax=Actinomadura pelletieri DSM 43383 TaxID=1120940 RepID=A0A495QAQ3_9ACTN|nr:nucleotide disphospho-sugar-binding domain-containing protein [Actinomadura pelletieri]RKS68745.1 MGT family glycosyltransferase [Actinomadura pelletieri DSM 43383]
MSARRKHVPSLLDDPGIRRARTAARRFLFAVPPPIGPVDPSSESSTDPNTDPLIAVAAELVQRGHKVAWTGHRPSLERLLRSGSRVFGSVDGDFAARLPGIRDDRLRLRGLAALRFHWEEWVVPLGHAMMPGVEKAIDRFRPDVVVSDQFVLAAPVAARHREIPWATAATTPVKFTRPLGHLPKVEEWVRERIADFQLDHGIDDLLDLRFSDHLVLVFSSGALVGDVSLFPDHFAFVGPVPGRAAPRAFPWDRLDGRPAVLVTLGAGTGPSGDRFLGVAAEAVRDMDVQAILVAPPGAVPDPPPNVLVRDAVPRLKLLEHLAAVVCDGDHGTVCESLSHGLPLVVAPVRDDQPVIARRVAAAGAGIAVRFARVRPDEIRTALTAVLADGSRHRAAAGRVRDSFASAGGVAEAADRLEKLT